VREVKELKTVARTDDYSDDSESEEEVEEVVGTALQLTRAELGGRHVFGLPLKLNGAPTERKLRGLELRQPDPQCWLDTGYPLPKQLRRVM